jgi:prevent-host-death family protein
MGIAMTTISFYEARTHFSQLLDEVARGKKVLITRRGKPAALLLPPPAADKKDVRKVIAEFKAFSERQGRTLGGQSAREWIEQGRRF